MCIRRCDVQRTNEGIKLGFVFLFAGHFFACFLLSFLVVVFDMPFPRVAPILPTLLSLLKLLLPENFLMMFFEMSSFVMGYVFGSATKKSTRLENVSNYVASMHDPKAAILARFWPAASPFMLVSIAYCCVFFAASLRTQ